MLQTRHDICSCGLEGQISITVQAELDTLNSSRANGLEVGEI